MMLERGKNKALENVAGEKTPSLNPSGCYLPEAEGAPTGQCKQNNLRMSRLGPLETISKNSFYRYGN